MSIKNIVGRRDEVARLDRCMESRSAQLIIVYGRRRVGKTYLINEYYNYKFAFKLTGAYKPKFTGIISNYFLPLMPMGSCRTGSMFPSAV
jgi:hypothetical protein